MHPYTSFPKPYRRSPLLAGGMPFGGPRGTAAPAPAPAWSPADLTFTTGIWLDPSDITTGFTDSAGTTQQTAGQVTGRRSDKSGRGLHVIQGTEALKPTYDVISSIASDWWDGSDDLLGTGAFTAGTLGSNMDCFIAMKRDPATQLEPIYGQSVGLYYSYMAGSGGSYANVGAVRTNHVDGVALADQLAPTLRTAVTASAWHIVEVRNLDLSTWTDFNLGGFTSYRFAGDIGGLILCPAQDSTTRGKIRTWLGAKVGLTL